MGLGWRLARSSADHLRASTPEPVTIARRTQNRRGQPDAEGHSGYSCGVGPVCLVNHDAVFPPRRKEKELSMSRNAFGVAAKTFGVVAMLAACRGDSERSSSDNPSGDGVDMQAIAATIVERTAPEPGERFLLVGQNDSRWDALLSPLREGLVARGAADLGTVDVRGETLVGAVPTEFTAQLGEGPDRWNEVLQQVDVAVKLPGAVPDLTQPTDLYRALQDLLRTGRGRTVHFHWAGKTSYEMEELPIDAAADAVYQRAVLETDYDALAETLLEFEAAVRAGTVRVTTPAGTDIVFDVGGEPVTRQDGDASAARAETGRNLIDREVELPAGAARILPTLESVEGTIAFPPAMWAGERAEGVVLHFERGRVTEVEAEVGREAVLEELEAGGEAARVFRELAVGFNPLLAIPEGENWIPYYGYGAGVVRLSLGDNTELGGTIGGGYVRWNFFVDATVSVGERFGSEMANS